MRVKLPLLLALLIAAAVMPGSPRWGGASRALAGMRPFFTAASLKGTCGFSAASTNVNPHSAGFLHPTSSYGTLVFDGISKVSGQFTVNDSGKLIPPRPFAGTYTVLSDGRTGQLVFTGVTYTFVITSGGAEIRYINVGPVDPATGIVDLVIIATCKF
jgi:hypothetical protein